MSKSIEGGSLNSESKQQSDGIDEVSEKLKNAAIDDSEEQTHGHLNQHHPSNYDENNSNCSKSDCFGEIHSHLPSDFDDVDNLFHINFMRSMQSILSHEKRYKNGTRRSCTFSNEQMRQIERENKILLNKILSQRPTTSIRKSANNHDRVRASSASRISSAAINRRHQQERIDFANNILRKKIERIALRNQK